MGSLDEDGAVLEDEVNSTAVWKAEVIGII